jgi:hypothetical protein
MLRVGTVNCGNWKEELNKKEIQEPRECRERYYAGEVGP